MASKGKKVASQKEENQKEPLQAVLLTDCYEGRFAPLTVEKPRCLLPLAGTPIIEYTLNFLFSNGVEELFIYCGNHQDQIEEYLSSTKWLSNVSPFSQVQLLRSTSTSVGDAMRDLDKREILNGDFVLVYGDVIANISLDSAIAAHKKHRLEDKNSIQTIILREPYTPGPIKKRKFPVFINNPNTNRCYQYEIAGAVPGVHHILVDHDIMLNVDPLELRSDLVDTGIDICTPDFLALWTDNFDFQKSRENFLHSVLKDYELNGKKIFVHKIKKGYIKRALNLLSYASISNDVRNRRSYPFCPEMNFLLSQNFRIDREFNYLDKNIQLQRQTKISGRSVIGSNTNIGDNTVISNSIIGSDVQIGDNVTIKDSFIWSNVKIGSRSIIETSLLADYVTVGQNCHLQPGSLLSFNVSLDNDIIIDSHTSITTTQSKDSSPLVGPSGTGSPYKNFDGEDIDEYESGLIPNPTFSRPESVYSCSPFPSTANSTSTSPILSPQAGSRPSHSRTSSMISDTYINDARRLDAAARDFHTEASTSLADALSRNDPEDTVLLELNGLRLASNASPASMRRAVAGAFVGHFINHVRRGEAAKIIVTDALAKYSEIWRRQVYAEEGTERIGDQVDLLVAVQGELAKESSKDGSANGAAGSVWVFLVQELVRLDIVEADGLEKWWDGKRSKDGGKDMEALRERVKTLVEFLINDDDDDDDDDEEEEEEEEEEDEDEVEEEKESSEEDD